MENEQSNNEASSGTSALDDGLGADRPRDKVVCSEFRCAWHGMDDAILRAPNPFDEGETLYACPKCKEVGSVVVACDEPGCWKEATCGMPTATPYRRTCGKHAPNVQIEATDAALSRQVASNAGLGVAVSSAPTFEQGEKT